MSKKNYLILPYNNSLFAVAWNLRMDGNKVEVCLTRDNGLSNNDLCRQKNIMNLGIQVLKLESLNIGKYDYLIYLETEDTDLCDKKKIDILIHEFLKNKEKKILTMYTGSEKQRKMCKEYNKQIVVFSRNTNKVLSENTPSCPIVSIGEYGKDLDGIYTLLELRRQFVKLGYSVLCYSDYAYSELVDVINYNYCLSGIVDSIESGINLLKGRIREDEAIYHPDIILLKLPGSIDRYNSRITLGYGAMSYLTMKGLLPDYNIVSVLYGNYEEVGDKLVKKYRYSYDCNLDAVEISNQIIDANAIGEDSEFITCHINLLHCQEMIEKMQEKYPLTSYVNAFFAESIQKLANDIINKLS
ncbi:MAG: hypothetical protein J1F02_04100 [Lachnospiraceae bacterium]|nr:hypothetical protein [Lachnospiraceae bacterium]